LPSAWKDEFILVNDIAKEVLFTIGLTSQVRALTAMISQLLLFITDFEKFAAKILEVCMTHEIMGIGFETYAHSAKVLSGAIQRLVGELGLSTFANVCDNENVLELLLLLFFFSRSFDLLTVSYLSTGFSFISTFVCENF
jgi:hypothetical protein